MNKLSGMLLVLLTYTASISRQVSPQSLQTISQTNTAVIPSSTRDVGTEINLAYAHLPKKGGWIYIQSKPVGSCYDYSTPIEFNTPGK